VDVAALSKKCEKLSHTPLTGDWRLPILAYVKIVYINGRERIGHETEDTR